MLENCSEGCKAGCFQAGIEIPWGNTLSKACLADWKNHRKNMDVILIYKSWKDFYFLPRTTPGFRVVASMIIPKAGHGSPAFFSHFLNTQDILPASAVITWRLKIPSMI
jgi:hypothetical protein